MLIIATFMLINFAIFFHMVDKSLILNKLKAYKNIKTDAEFADFLGISTQNISAWHKRNTFNNNIIVDKFPEVDESWLLTGKGEMLKKTDELDGNEIVRLGDVDDAYAKAINRLFVEKKYINPKLLIHCENL